MLDNRTAWQTCLRNITSQTLSGMICAIPLHNALAQGLRIEYVSEILGHSDISITQKYAHVLPSALHNAVKY